MDSGSERSFITESCAERLGLKQGKQPPQFTGIGNSTKLHQDSQVGFQVCSRFNEDELHVEAYVPPKIAGGSVPYFSKALGKPFKAIQPLADVNYNQQRSIDVLLGSDVFEQVVLDEK